MNTWSEEYHYTFTMQHGSICHMYRYLTFEEYLTDLLEFLSRPHAEVLILVADASV